MSVRSRRRLLPVAGACAALTLLVAGCGAEGNDASSNGDGGGGDGGSATFQRPIDMVIPFGPGGGADQVGRTVATAMEKEIDQQIPAVNVPGSTGSTGITKMLSGRPGESMAILIQDTLTTVPAGSASFDLDELRAVCRLQSMPSALMVRKGTYADWEELAADAKSKPGELKVATVGANSVDDIVLAAIEQELGIEFRAVPFSEPSERYAALLGGQVDALYEQLGDVKQYLDSGDFEPVVLFADAPVEGVDGVPTAEELGLPAEVVLPQFRGIVMSSDTSDDVVQALSDACQAAVESDKMQEFQAKVFAAEDSYQPADEFQNFLQEQESLIAEQLDSYGIGG
jgi:tripartite-type tricarboxylate transporter receptor subunit TctC